MTKEQAWFEFIFSISFISLLMGIVIGLLWANPFVDICAGLLILYAFIISGHQLKERLRERTSDAHCKEVSVSE